MGLIIYHRFMFEIKYMLLYYGSQTDETGETNKEGETNKTDETDEIRHIKKN